MAVAVKRNMALFALGWFTACAEPLPGDIENYREECLKMNCEPIAVSNDDPHEGLKDVFACNVSEEALLETLDGAPYPDGTIIVKESTRSDSDYPWLVATARKRGDAWKWDEYTRNFENEEFLRIVSGESVCTDCHDRAINRDWIFTVYRPEAACAD
jgi:hypothetical protein